jgi:hypothetical protein
MQVTYIVTPAAPAKEEPPKPATTTYSYTIQL